MMKVICVQDGMNDFGTSGGAVKRGEVYHVLDLADSSQLLHHPHNPHKGLWYHLMERPDWHWHGLFLEIPEPPEAQEQILISSPLKDHS